MTANVPGRVVSAIHMNNSMLLRRKAHAIVIPRFVVVEVGVWDDAAKRSGTADSVPATYEKSASRWMEYGYTSPEGGDLKWKANA